MRLLRANARMLPALVLCLMVVIAVASACGGKTPVVSTTSGTSTTPGGSATTATSVAADGKALFAANCVRCHGADLAGGVGPKISGRSEADRGRIQTHIKSGGAIMPAFGGKFTDDQIAAIATYVISVK